MGKRNKLWKSITVIGFAGAAGISMTACTEEESEGEAAVAQVEASAESHAHTDSREALNKSPKSAIIRPSSIA